MTNNAFVGKAYLERGDTGSPIAYTRLCQVTDISGLGQANPLVDVSTLCSTAKEYVGGLADGSEITLKLNYETASADELSMINDVKNKATRAYRLVFDPDGDGIANQSFYFNGLALSWTLAPSLSAANTISFGIKISGDVTVT